MLIPSNYAPCAIALILIITLGILKYFDWREERNARKIGVHAEVIREEGSMKLLYGAMATVIAIVFQAAFKPNQSLGENLLFVIVVVPVVMLIFKSSTFRNQLFIPIYQWSKRG